MNPKISVIIPTYNRAQLVVQTIQSVLAQSYLNYEVIVVDDGSTDETEKAIAPLFGEKVSYHYQSNQGRSAARNHGTKIAEGAWLMFLDSDDLLTPVALETLVKYSLKFPAVQMVAGKIDMIDSENNRLPETAPNAGIKISRGLLNKPYLEMIRGKNFPMGTYIVKKEIIEKTGGFDSALEPSEDFDFNLRLALECDIYDIAETVALIRSYDGNSDISKQRYAQIAIAKKHLQNFVPFLSPPTKKSAIGKFYLSVGDNYYELKQNTDALKNYLAALRFDVKSLFESNVGRQILASMLPNSIKGKFKAVSKRG